MDEIDTPVGQFDDFHRACGVIGPVELQVERGLEVSSLKLDRPFAILGNCFGADIVPNEASQLGYSAYFQILGGRLFCVELENRTNNPARASSCGIWLSQGQSGRFGSVTIRVAGITPGIQSPIASGALPQLVIEGPESAVWRIESPLAFIGSSANCDIRLLGPGVAPFHAAIVVTAHGIWLVGLIRRRPAIDGLMPIVVRCKDGFRLRIGEFVLRFNVASTDEPRFAIASPIATTSIAPIERVDNSLQVQMEEFMGMQQQMFAQFHETVALVVNSLGGLHQDLVELLRFKMERVDRLDRELIELRSELSRLEQERTSDGASFSRKALAETPVPPTHRPPPTPQATKDGVGSSDPTNVHAWLSERVAELHQERQSVWTQVCSYLNVLKSSTKPPSASSSN